MLGVVGMPDAEDRGPADKARHFAASLVRAATMHAPPPRLAALADRAATAPRVDDAYEDRDATVTADGADAIALRGHDAAKPSLFSLADLRTGRKATSTEVGTMFAHLKTLARRKKEHNNLKRRLETYNERIDERTDELRRAADADAGLSVQAVGGDVAAAAALQDPVALSEQPQVTAVLT